MELVPSAQGAARRPGKIKNKKEKSYKLQAPSLTMRLGYCKISIERK